VCVGVDATVTKCTTTSAAPTITTTSKPISTTSPTTTTTLQPYSYISSTVINAQPTVTELQPFGVPSPVQAGIYSGCETYYQAVAVCLSRSHYSKFMTDSQRVTIVPRSQTTFSVSMKPSSSPGIQLYSTTAQIL
jgi:hypothetical protein